jgi:hypothetical protein
VHFKVDSSEAHHPNLEHWIHGREYHTVDVVSQDGSNEGTFFESNDRRSSLPIAESPSQMLKKRMAKKVKARKQSSNDFCLKEEMSHIPSVEDIRMPHYSSNPTGLFRSVENIPERSASILLDIITSLSTISHLSLTTVGNAPIIQQNAAALPDAQGDLARLSIEELTVAFGQTASELIQNVLIATQGQQAQQEASEMNDTYYMPNRNELPQICNLPCVDSTEGTPSALYTKVQAAETKKASHSSIPDTTPSELVQQYLRTLMMGQTVTVLWNQNAAHVVIFF